MKESYYKKCPLPTMIDVTGLYTAFQKTMPPAMGSDGERHDFWEMVVVMEGELSVATERELTCLKAGQMIIHSPMEYHRHFNSGDKDVTFGVISFECSNMPSVQNFVYLLSEGKLQEFCKIVSLIRENFRTGRHAVFDPREPQTPICQLVRLQLEGFLLVVLPSQSILRDSRSEDYKRIVEYMEDNLHRSLTLQEMARDLNMSLSNMKRIFSAYAGVGIIHHFNHLRIRRATQLLQQGMRVRDVAEMLGFSSQSAFCTCFKNVTGRPQSHSCRQ